MLNAYVSHRPTSVMTAVNFGELKVSRNPTESLVAFSIGSGIAVSIYDPVMKAGALLNFVLPDSSALSPQKVKCHPFMFADTGLAASLDALQDIGAKTDNLKIVIAGGAQILDQILDQTAAFNMGHQNHEAVISFLGRKNLAIDHADIGDMYRRTLRLDIGNGGNRIQTLGQGEVTV